MLKKGNTADHYASADIFILRALCAYMNGRSKGKKQIQWILQKKILLNDILKIENVDNVKIRFNLMFDGNWNPIEIFKNNKQDALLRGQYWNYKDKKSIKDGQITIGFIRIYSNENLWFLFHIGKITKDLNKFSGV